MRKNTNKLWSAYNPNQGKVGGNYGPLFYGITALINPKLAVEIGVCKGYSTVYIAQAIKDCNNGGVLKCYDLWDDETKKTNITEDQHHKHLSSSAMEICDTLYYRGLSKVVNIHTEEAFSVLPGFSDNSIDLIHLDIGNCGGVIFNMLPEVLRTLRVNGYFLFEGGAEHRDKVKWMLEYEKNPISFELANNKKFENFQHLTFSEACSLTICRRIK